MTMVAELLVGYLALSISWTYPAQDLLDRTRAKRECRDSATLVMMLMVRTAMTYVP